jgi:hypothetical protein
MLLFGLFGLLLVAGCYLAIGSVQVHCNSVCVVAAYIHSFIQFRMNINYFKHILYTTRFKITVKIAVVLWICVTNCGSRNVN